MSKEIIRSVIDRVLWTAGATEWNRDLLTDAISEALAAARQVVADDGLVPISVDGKSVWLEGIGAVALDYSSVKSLSDIQDAAAPARPRAVPDGFEQVRFHFFKELNTEERKKVFKAFGVWPGDGEGEGKNIPHIWETLLLRAIFNIAAPAAQGDAKDAELRTLYTSQLIGAAWDRRVGSCNANKTIFESDKSHFVSGWNSALDAAIAAKAAS